MINYCERRLGLGICSFYALTIIFIYSTNRASNAFVSMINDRLPFVTTIAIPPHFFSLPAVISVGFNAPFNVGCHSDAKSGLVVAKSLYPTRILWFEQYGQFLRGIRVLRNHLLPLVTKSIDLIRKFHLWPHLPTHHTFLCEPRPTSVGLSSFLSKSHSSRSFGLSVAKSL